MQREDAVVGWILKAREPEPEAFVSKYLYVRPDERCWGHTDNPERALGFICRSDAMAVAECFSGTGAGYTPVKRVWNTEDKRLRE
jgi:hypothetical protein